VFSCVLGTFEIILPPCAWEIEKFIIRQPPIGEKDDYDSETGNDDDEASFKLPSWLTAATYAGALGLAERASFRVPAMGFPIRIYGRGRGINLFPQWCLVATGNRNRQHLWAWSHSEAAGG